MDNENFEPENNIDINFGLSKTMLKRYAGLGKYCAMESSGDYKFLRAIIAFSLGVSRRKAVEYISDIEALGIITIRNGKWAYNSENRIKDHIQRYKQTEAM